MTTKAEWRARAKRARSTLPMDDPRHVEGLAQFLGGPGREPGWVVGYRAMPGEVALDRLFSRHDLGPFALVRTPDEGLDLTVHPAGSPAERHRYGFDQPAAGSPVVPDAEIGVVLVPGLAFDRRGARLGHGKGYYDRFLTRLAAIGRARFVGVTGGYVVAELPTEPHDVMMSHLAGTFGVVAVPLPEPAG
ncbi:MAG: 5-formyltetrahydrofolate cyclo-ligase [Acidimicrobiales bacterium]